MLKKNFLRLSFFCLFIQLVNSAHAVACQSVDQLLAEMVGTDQDIRREWTVLDQNPNATNAEKAAALAKQNFVDSSNLSRLKEMIAACGWPREKESSHYAWLLAQHADGDIAFQHLAKNYLEASVKASISAPRDLAYLSDRIAANEGRPQEYGTQFTQIDQCHLTLDRVDSIELVNKRRFAIGLPSVEEYIAEGRRHFLAPDCPK